MKYIPIEIDGKYIAVEINEGACINLRNPSEKEIKEAIKIQQLTKKYNKELKKVNKMKEELKHCPHTIIYDEPGFIYDARYCWACGRLVGSV